MHTIWAGNVIYSSPVKKSRAVVGPGLTGSGAGAAALRGVYLRTPMRPLKNHCPETLGVHPCYSLHRKAPSPDADRPFIPRRATLFTFSGFHVRNMLALQSPDLVVQSSSSSPPASSATSSISMLPSGQ